MSEPSKAAELTHRIIQPMRRGTFERSWSCPRCEGRGYVIEIVVMAFGEQQRQYRSASKCRCPAAEKQSPSMAVCSDAFWYGMSEDEVLMRKAGLMTSEPLEPEPGPEPEQPQTIIPFRQPAKQQEPAYQPPPPEPWDGPVFEEIDP